MEDLPSGGGKVIRECAAQERPGVGGQQMEVFPDPLGKGVGVGRNWKFHDGWDESVRELPQDE